MKREPKQSIREREEQARRIVDEMNEQEPFEFTRKDILAMVIAGYQATLPIILAGAGIIILCYVLFLLFLT